jgi:transcriptional regulator with XRE-family HTH domain
MPGILVIMLGLIEMGKKIAARRKELGMTQSELSRKTRISRSTLDALENGRIGELGFSKVSKILSALNLELKLHDGNLQRPTLEELLEEDRNDKGLDRRG